MAWGCDHFFDGIGPPAQHLLECDPFKVPQPSPDERGELPVDRLAEVLSMFSVSMEILASGLGALGGGGVCPSGRGGVGRVDAVGAGRGCPAAALGLGLRYHLLGAATEGGGRRGGGGGVGRWWVIGSVLSLFGWGPWSGRRTLVAVQGTPVTKGWALRRS